MSTDMDRWDAYQFARHGDTRILCDWCGHLRTSKRRMSMGPRPDRPWEPARRQLVAEDVCVPGRVPGDEPRRCRDFRWASDAKQAVAQAVRDGRDPVAELVAVKGVQG